MEACLGRLAVGMQPSAANHEWHQAPAALRKRLVFRTDLVFRSHASANTRPLPPISIIFARALTGQTALDWHRPCVLSRFCDGELRRRPEC